MMQQLDVLESCKCTTCFKITCTLCNLCMVAGITCSVFCGCVDHEDKGCQIPRRQGQHKLHLPCCVLYNALAVSLLILLCLSLLSTFSSSPLEISTFLSKILWLKFQSQVNLTCMKILESNQFDHFASNYRPTASVAIQVKNCRFELFMNQ